MSDLLTILNKLESPGTFSARGTMQSLLPGLYIDHVGEISFPLRPEQAEQIMAQCEQAPYGFKEETIIDTNVRKHGFKTYRYYRQKYTTARLRISKAMMDEILWPDYLRYSKMLSGLVEEIMSNLINKIHNIEDDEVVIAGEIGAM